MKNKLKKVSLLTLFKVLIRLRKNLRVVENGMEPTLYEGDIIVYRPLRGRLHLLREDQIVVFTAKPSFEIVGRIKSITSSGVEIIGDNEETSKDSRTIEPESVLGIVEALASARK